MKRAGVARRILNALFGSPADKLQTQLTEAEVIVLAKESVGADPLRDHLTMATAQDRSGRIVWLVSAPVIGRTLDVEIDDQSGEVLGVLRGGIR